MTTAPNALLGASTPANGSPAGVTAWSDIHPGDEIRLPSHYSSDGWNHEISPPRDGPMYVLTTQFGGPQIIQGGRLVAGCIRTYTATTASRRDVTAYTDINAR